MRQIRAARQDKFFRFRIQDLIAIFWLAIVFPLSSSAQMAPSNGTQPAAVEIPENLTRGQVRDLVAHLSDDQVRELIITRLDKLALEQEQAVDPTVYAGLAREGMYVAWDAFVRIFTSDNLAADNR
jgi:hypothetical protein